MLSRVAETLYWMARNIERAENNARIIAARLSRMPESWEEGEGTAGAASAGSDRADGTESGARWAPFRSFSGAGADGLAQGVPQEAELNLAGDWEELLEINASLADYLDNHSELVPGEILHYLTFSESNPNSIASCIDYARNNARSARDAIPHELWETLNDMYWNVRGSSEEGGELRDYYPFLQAVKVGSFTTQGVIESLMPRGAPYLFVQTGKWLERAEKTARILNVVCAKAMKPEEQLPSRQYVYWLTALELVGGSDAFLRQYPPYMHPKDVLAFLMADRAYPRSIRYCVDHFVQAMYRLEDEGVTLYTGPLVAAVEQLSEQFGQSRIHEWPLHDLERYLDRFQNLCNEIGALVTGTLRPDDGFRYEAMMCIQE